MSAILPGAPNSDVLGGSLGPDGIRRYKTRCKILVDSQDTSAGRESSTLEIIDDVYAVQTSKTLKGGGQATVSLTPSENYLNLLFPNDYINIYFDIGDGAGWTRTFFGFIDRVEETYAVSSTGAPSTTYRVVCSDFYKAFEKTMIYFNPQLFGREDFNNYDFASPNIGGLALMTKGLVAGGAPPDVVTNVILLLLGFGTQFSLPDSYNPGSTRKRLRQRRADLVYGQLSPEAEKNIEESGKGGSGGTYRTLRNQANAEASATAENFKAGGNYDAEQRVRLLAKSLGVSFESLEGTDESRLSTLLADYELSQQISLKDTARATAGTERAATQGAINVLDSTQEESSSLIDIIDTFTFVERRAMDGYMIGKPVWQRQGSLMSILMAFSNECMNELFFDLRPLSSEGTSGISADPVVGRYATIADDKRGNKTDGTGPNGVTYIPALVMREYPFSMIRGLDLKEVELDLKNEHGFAEEVGVLYFGAIFSDQPNQAGRHVIEIENINLSDKALGESTKKGFKHLDVAVISEKEIISTTLGRSDNDHFNLFEFFSDNLLGQDQRFYMRDMLPIITPIHILRNGLRVRSVTTRAARLGLEAIRNLQQRPVGEEETQAKDEDDVPESAGDFNAIQVPVSEPTRIRFNNALAQAKWGYRDKPARTPPGWRFHHGVDIIRTDDPSEWKTNKIPVFAIADGIVVHSTPVGGWQGYGNVVVIKHKFQGIAGYRYSVYGHLSERVVGPFPSVPTILGDTSSSGARARARKKFAAAERATGVNNGKAGFQKVTKGQLIGYVGGTGYQPSNVRDHLHFEITRHFPPVSQSNGPVPLVTPAGGTQPPTPSNFDETGLNTSIMRAANQTSCDPVQFFTAGFGHNLQDEINQGIPPAITYNESSDVGDGTATDEEAKIVPKEDTLSEVGKEEEAAPETYTRRESVDTASVRSQIIRWALLQDHWYQHNLEYLSGRVDMRGAPEVRVGYRLDLDERQMSFYVEGVNHNWKFPNNMLTSLQVTRGQPNNPYPVYVLPSYKQMGATPSQRRTAKSRLATYFVTPDPIAIRRSLFIRNNEGPVTAGSGRQSLLGPGSNTINETDKLTSIEFDTDTFRSKIYDETVIPAGSDEFYKAMANDEVTEATEDTNENSRVDSTTGVDSRGGIDKENPTEIDGT